MKAFLFLILSLIISSCACCGKEDGDFDPYPGGKQTHQKTPK